MNTARALVITRTRYGLRASCACGADLGESVSWDASVAMQRAHNDSEHQAKEDNP